MKWLLVVFAAVGTPIVVTGNVISTANCFELGAPVVVDFVNDDPRRTDWIGIYNENDRLDALPAPSFDRWIWACGSQFCSRPRRRGRATLHPTIPIGSYKAVLAIDSGTIPYTGKVQTQIFDVRISCQQTTIAESTPIPTPIPTPLPTPIPTPTPTQGPTPLPTPLPTPTPTPQPTPLPTPQPIQTPSTQILTDKLTYNFREEVVVSFSVQNPLNDDFVAIYSEDIPNHILMDGELWQWAACGGQARIGCNFVSSTGTLNFNEITNSRSDWRQVFPLTEGRYKAYLLREGDRPFQMVAVSDTFEILPPAPEDLLQVTPSLITQAREDIEALINTDIALAAKFLRLSFHDCVGGCDGCVDLVDPENAGLLGPIEALQSIVNKYADTELTRADIWMLSAVVGADISQPDNDRINFPFRFYGRQNCEDVNPICLDQSGQIVDCHQTRGPFRHVPGMDTHTHELFEFFEEEFGFNMNQTVALMGAHTLGELSRQNSGVDGPNGWLLNNRVLDNEYYIELVGGESVNDPIQVLIDTAPNWQRDLENNRDLAGIPNRHVWTGFPDNTKIVMLNVDVAIVRNLSSSNTASSGRVFCGFRRTGACPHAEGALQKAAEYRFNNFRWVRDFRAALLAMVDNGYDRPGICLNGSACRLIRRI
eukprot:CAMPEP_0202441846 /NCGR_PEP_ID=MMETSP1360-20130828/1354_1 /ASSEMBLY_ACC=CAM_ASM_000848 /TAXON_ID=515479 /ORGANISM="Licmophora paradoxa, Strain CCMP2313" /LENGTH=650 /DNA_ID=CAMNT_0049057019 /DNA_START=102 /DNA_END=2054 /DNA_ORIENTATION=-